MIMNSNTFVWWWTRWTRLQNDHIYIYNCCLKAHYLVRHSLQCYIKKNSNNHTIPYEPAKVGRKNSLLTGCSFRPWWSAALLLLVFVSLYPPEMCSHLYIGPLCIYSVTVFHLSAYLSLLVLPVLLLWFPVLFNVWNFGTLQSAIYKKKSSYSVCFAVSCVLRLGPKSTLAWHALVPVY